MDRYSKIVLTVIAVAILPASTLAQTTVVPPEQDRCWLGSSSSSPGATLRAGGQVMVCTPAFTWEPTTAAAAGCLHMGDFYSVGAIQNGSNAQQRLAQCQADGTWTLLPTTAPR